MNGRPCVKPSQQLVKGDKVTCTLQPGPSLEVSAARVHVWPVVSLLHLYEHIKFTYAIRAETLGAANLRFVRSSCLDWCCVRPGCPVARVPYALLGQNRGSDVRLDIV